MRRLHITAVVAAAALSLAVVATPVAARQPGATIVDTAIAVNAATGEFDELIGAVVRAGLVDELDGHRQLTVFAPTDAAFAGLVRGARAWTASMTSPCADAAGRPAPPRGAGRDGPAATSSTSTRIRTLGRDFLFPVGPRRVAYVDGARILLADVDASNGVIHVIDRVLVPGS